jgi:ABC-type amino acid transport system permease subunit
MKPKQNKMTLDECSLQLDLAAAQIVTSVLVTLGSTLFAISIGIQLTLPPVAKDMIDQVMVNQIIASEIQYDVVQQALDNYIVLLAGIGAILIVIGIAYGSAKISMIRKKVKAAKNIESI